MNRSKIPVVGVGPGAPDLITQKAKSLIERADCVFGFNSALKVVDKLITGQKFTLNYSNQDAMLRKLVESYSRGYSCVVCLYGDPNVSEKEFIERLLANKVPIEVIPGISAIQAACAKLGLALEESIIITLHKRGSIENEKEELFEQVLSGKRNVFLLPRPWDFMPKEIACYLISRNINPLQQTIILQNLTLPSESENTYTLMELAKSDTKFSDLTVVAFIAKR